jgi:hypothetical protein
MQPSQKCRHVIQPGIRSLVAPPWSDRGVKAGIL